MDIKIVKIGKQYNTQCCSEIITPLYTADQNEIDITSLEDILTIWIKNFKYVDIL